MTTNEIESVDLAGVGQKLLTHSKSAEFTARRGLVVEMYPFIFAAGERMSARAIGEYLGKTEKIKLSGVTINKALKDPHKNWNLYFDEIEPAARIFEKDDGKPMRDFLFAKQYFFKPIKNPVIKGVVTGMAKVLITDEVAYASNILRNKWFNVDWEIRMKARPYLMHRLA
jgi:hypothetical protein